MTDESLFYNLFNRDQQKYTRQFLKSIPAKANHLFSDSFHQYQNQYTIEYVNGKVVTESATASCGMAQRIIENELLNHKALPLSVNTDTLIPISQKLFANKKRVSFIKKAESTVLDKNSAIEGLALKWVAFEKYMYITNSNNFAASKKETFASISVSVKIKRNRTLYNGKAILSVKNEVKSLNAKRLAELIEIAYKDAQNSAVAKQLPSGNYDALLSNNASALFFHEVIGHSVEADYVYNNLSLLKSMRGDKIASPQLTIMDDPNIDGPVAYPFDDEGTAAQPTMILEKGVLKNFLTDHYHASAMGITKTGNARRLLYSSLPLPRMSNTKIMNGSYPFAEMLESMAQGILISDLGSGYANTETGNFQFEGAAGFLIENGSIKSPLINLKITGDILNTLKSVKMVGDDYHISQFHADCEKESQILPVGFSQPSIKISSVKIS